MTSSVPGFKAALKARWTAAFPDRQVSWGNPYPEPQDDELIIIGDTKNRVRQFTAGMSAANETYDVEILVSVVGSSRESQEELLARAYVIADALEADILEWRLTGFGGTVNTVVPGASNDEEATDGKVREASITFELSVTARV